MIIQRLTAEREQMERRQAIYGVPEVPSLDPDPLLDLMVVAACWRQCLDVGYSAVRRAVTVLEAIAGTNGVRDSIQRDLRVALRDFERGQITATRLGQTVEWIAAEADPGRYVARGA